MSSNDKKVNIFKVRKLLRILIIIFGLATLILAIYSLVKKTTPLYALLSFIIEVVLSKIRNELDFSR